MVQGYAQQNSGSEGGWTFFLGSRTAEERSPSAETTESRSYISRPYTCGASMTNGLHVAQKNLNYQELKRLIEKLEGLC